MIFALARSFIFIFDGFTYNIARYLEIQLQLATGTVKVVNFEDLMLKHASIP